jgi:hypothetical membrane protein
MGNRGYPRKETRHKRFAGIFFGVLAAQFIIVYMLAAAIAPAYDFKHAAISDLGTLPSTAVVFNTSLIVVGLCNILGGYYYFRIHRTPWLLILFVLAGLGAAGAGFFPLDKFEIHGVFALAAFLFFNVQAIASGTLLRGPIKVFAFIAGILGLVYVVVMIIGDSGNTAIFGPIGHGGAERMIVYPPMLWLLVFGGYLMGES